MTLRDAQFPEAARCLTCQFWVTRQPGGTENRVGECRRLPPQIVSRTEDYSRPLGGGDFSEGISTSVDSEWPDTKDTDWCGEYRKDDGA